MEGTPRRIMSAPALVGLLASMGFTPKAPASEPLRRKEGRSLPIGMQYIGHCGERARLRYLRQSVQRIQREVHRDPEARVAFARLMRATHGVPEEFGVVHGTWTNLALAALRVADETQTTWAQSMNVQLALWEAMEEQEQEEATAQ